MFEFKSIGLSLLLLTSSVANAAVDQKPAIPTIGDLYRAFETVVFGQEFGNRKPRSEVLKWEQPLRIAIRAYGDVITDHGNDVKEIAFDQIPVSDKHYQVTKRHLEVLSGLINIEMEDYIKAGREPNLTINFVPKIHLANPILVNHQDVGVRQLASQNGCYFVIWKNPKTRAIDRVVVVVNTDRDDASVSHCILEELTQSLGLPNDNNVSWGSIFSNSQRVVELSRSDRIILQTLYDPQIKSGMDKKSVMRKALTIIKSLNRQN